ncbi:hypothetical protein H7F33_07110 [Pedobacter sp. PAMC26386]|nr:hypothetical protein H7F33_07110 [Pedobacter sp. PAMC26386]
MSTKQNLNKVTGDVHVYGVNAEETTVDLWLTLTEFVNYMNGLTVEDFKDFTKLNISFSKPFTILQDN